MKCTAPVINKRQARLTNPRRRKRVPFRCAKSKFLGLGNCTWELWVSPNPITVMFVFWRDPRDGAWYVVVETRGIEPGIGRQAFVAGFVEPGATNEETGVEEGRQEVRLRLKRKNLRYIGQAVSPSNPFMLFSFYATRLLGRKTPKLVPDGTETRDARWIRVDRLAEDADLVWAWQVDFLLKGLATFKS